MRVVSVTIEGTKPILLHNPAGMSDVNTSGKKKIPTKEEEAAAGCYWDEKKTSLVFPALNIHRSMVLAAGAFKAGKLSMSPYVAGGVELQPDDIPFRTKKYCIDYRRAVIQRQGIMRARPKLPDGLTLTQASIPEGVKPWQLSFSILVNEQDLPQKSSLEMLKGILEEAGRRLGIGDYRPQKTGPFGKFVVTKWEET